MKNWKQDSDCPKIKLPFLEKVFRKEGKGDILYQQTWNQEGWHCEIKPNSHPSLLLTASLPTDLFPYSSSSTATRHFSAKIVLFPSNICTEKPLAIRVLRQFFCLQVPSGISTGWYSHTPSAPVAQIHLPLNSQEILCQAGETGTRNLMKISKLGEEQPHESDWQRSSAAGKASKWNRSQQYMRDWSIWQTRREWESQDCSACKGEGTNAPWERGKMKEPVVPSEGTTGNEQNLQYRTFCVGAGKNSCE